MKILCMTPIEHLDGALNLINQFGEVTYIPNISKNEVKAKLIEKNITHIFTNPNKQNFILNAELLSNTSVKVINTCSTGLNHIDERYCSDNNIEIWSLTKDLELINDLPSTSELAFGLMMSLLRFIPTSFHSVKDGNWDYEPYVGFQVKGKTVGIIGYGRLGKIMKRLFDGWGVDILVTDPYARITSARGVSLDELLEIFFKTHDPTTLNRQGNDIGTQYRSAIFYENENELKFFEDYINKLNESNSFSSKIVTSLEKKSHFYDAEEYHHNYFEKNPLNGYCNMVVRPKVEKFRNENK